MLLLLTGLELEVLVEKKDIWWVNDIIKKNHPYNCLKFLKLLYD